MNPKGKKQTQRQIIENNRIETLKANKLQAKKENLTLCKKITSEIVFKIMDEFGHIPIEIRQSFYGSIYIDIYDKTIRISDHEITDINYDYQIIINKNKQDKISDDELVKIIYQ